MDWLIDITVGTVVDVIVTYHSKHSEADSAVAAIVALGRKAVAPQLDASKVGSLMALSPRFASALDGRAELKVCSQPIRRSTMERPFVGIEEGKLKEREPVGENQKRHAVTAHDVARVAGVSQSAVSRVFTPGASVSPATNGKVMEAARALGYRPNLVARSLITRRSNIVGVAVPGTANPFYGAALDALSLAFADIGYRVLLFTTDPVAGSDPILEEVLRYRVDALVLISTSLSSHFAEECVQVGLPVVLLNRRTGSASASSVTGDNERGARLVAAYLLAGGHKRFAFLAGQEKSSTSRDREKGFFDHLTAHRVRRIDREVGDYSASTSAAAARRMLSRAKPPDAIFCANDYMALSVINVAEVEFGLRVGTDMSVVGFDDIDMASWPMFSLTTYSQPVTSMAAQAVKIVKDQLDDHQADPVQHVTSGELVVRRSARVPKSGLEQSSAGSIWAPRADWDRPS